VEQGFSPAEKEELRLALASEIVPQGLKPSKIDHSLAGFSTRQAKIGLAWGP
jgi:hypothetical protein